MTKPSSTAAHSTPLAFRSPRTTSPTPQPRANPSTVHSTPSTTSCNRPDASSAPPVSPSPQSGATKTTTKVHPHLFLPLLPLPGADTERHLGTRQAYVPGESRRTGPPGRQHPYHGKKYQLLDEQVRFFVSPGAETLRNTEVRFPLFTSFSSLSPPPHPSPFSNPVSFPSVTASLHSLPLPLPIPSHTTSPPHTPHPSRRADPRPS